MVLELVKNNNADSVNPASAYDLHIQYKFNFCKGTSRECNYEHSSEFMEILKISMLNAEHQSRESGITEKDL